VARNGTRPAGSTTSSGDAPDEDDLMRIFGSDRISGLMARIGMGDGVPIEHRMVSKAIERAQRQVEGQNFSMRKHLLEYDDVMNKQRETIYKMRKEILEGKDMKSYIDELIETLVDWHLDSYANKDKAPEDWDVEALKQAVGTQFGLNVDDLKIDWSAVAHDELRERIVGTLKSMYGEKERILAPARMREFERIIMLQVIDSQWKDHLLGMDYLKEGIGLRGYGQRDPLVEYKKESYDMFQAMMDRVEEDTVRYLFLIQPVVEEELPQRRQQQVYYQQAPGAAPPPRGRQVRTMIPKGKRKH
jgi:preprotein translocase subunit SecA